MFKAVESVTSGNPDKVCDQIADAILDEYLRRDPDARVDIKVLGSHGMLMIGGEVNSTADFDCAALAKKVYEEIGYKDEIEVFVNLEPPSDEMKTSRGSNDTVIVNGYATKETREFLPRPLVYAHNIARRIDDLRKTNPSFHWIGPDGKVQVVMRKNEVHSVTVLAQHPEEMNTNDVQQQILDNVVVPLIGEGRTQLYINPLGKFVTAGFHADTGVSGRKNACDFYGGLIPHGDATLSGRDPQRAERAGAYMARYVAKQLVHKGLANAVMISLAYTMGRPEPIMINVRAMGAKGEGENLDFNAFVKDQYNFHLDAIVEFLQLKQPLYRNTATYGHFGKSGLPWEEVE